MARLVWYMVVVAGCAAPPPTAPPPTLVTDGGGVIETTTESSEWDHKTDGTATRYRCCPAATATFTTIVGV